MLSTINILVFIAIFIAPSWTFIPYDEVSINIFDSKQTSFEFRVFQSTKMVKGFFGRDDVLLAMAVGQTSLKFLPFVGEFAKIIPLMKNTLENRGEWQTAFTKAVKYEVMRSITDSEIRWMDATMKTIQDKIKLLDETNPDMENRKTIASIIHTDLDKMINFFDLKSSLFRKYPLLGAAPLIQLASVVALFSPLARQLIPFEANNPQLSCKIHEVLLDYCQLTVVARMHKLRISVSIGETLFEGMRNESSFVAIMSMPYNENGYNTTNPPVIDCQSGCDGSRLVIGDACLQDAFSVLDYYSNDVGSTKCTVDYGALMRHRIEQLFPVDLLHSLCIDQKPQIPTGYGWFTFNLLQAFKFEDSHGSRTNIYVPYLFDIYVKLFVNGKQVLETPKKSDKIHANDDITYQSEKIPKTSIIKLQLWSSAVKPWTWGKDKLIFNSEGDVESFLLQPLREDAQNIAHIGALETISFWRDEYE